MNIYLLNVKPITYYKLQKRGIHTVEELLDLSKKDLLNLRGVGNNTIRDIEICLKKRNLKLKEEVIK